MTKQQIDLLIEANNLAANLLEKMTETSALADELKNSFDHWIEVQTEANRISRILTKAIARCKRRALA